MTEPWLGVEEAARYLSVSTKTIRRYAAVLGACRFGARLLFKASRIDSAVERGALGPRRGGAMAKR